MASAYDKASLVMLPNAYKDGKLYSVKPEDRSGDFTFSRGSNLSATRVDANGLIEKGRENLALQGSDISTQSGSWVANQGGVTTQNATTSPIGTNTASQITANGSSTYSGVSQTGIAMGALRYTYSVYLKAQSGTPVIRLTSYDGVTFHQQDFSITTEWERYSITFTPTAGTHNIYITSQQGVSWYAWGAQFELGLVATDYIETGASTAQAGILEDLPRLDYSGGASCPSLLLEPSRSQLIKFSEYYGDNLLVNATIDTNNATSPEGIQNATLLIENTSSGNHALRENESTQIAADDSQYVISFYAKSNGRNIRFIDDGYSGSGTIVNFNLSSGGTFSNGALVIDSDAVAVGSDGWYYCYGVIDKAANQSNFRFSLRLLGGASNINDSYTGDGTSSVWIWGKQIEDASSYPTSYIPNHSGGTITRAEDVCGGAGDASTFNSTEGVLYTELSRFASDGVVDYCSIGLSDGTNNNQVIFKFRNSINTFYTTIQSSNGNTRIDLSHTFSDLSETTKIAIKYKVNDFALWVNGVEVRTSNNANTPIGMDTLNFSTATNGEPFYGNVKQVLTFNTALLDTELAALTRPYENYQEWVTGEGLTWESPSCTNNNITELKNL